MLLRRLPSCQLARSLPAFDYSAVPNTVLTLDKCRWSRQQHWKAAVRPGTHRHAHGGPGRNTKSPTRKTYTRTRDKRIQAQRDALHKGKLVIHSPPTPKQATKKKLRKKKPAAGEETSTSQDLTSTNAFKKENILHPHPNVTPKKKERLTLDEVVEIIKTEKAVNIVVIDMRSKCDFIDYFIICEGFSARHRRAIADQVVEEMKKRTVYDRASVEGKESKHWAVVDVGDMAVHVFSDEGRRYYDLEELWCIRKDFVTLLSGENEEWDDNDEDDFTKEDYFEDIRLVDPDLDIHQ